MRHLAVVVTVFCIGTSAARAQEPAQPSRADIDFFEAKVRPVLVERCFRCHAAQAKKSKGNLRLDSRANILKGGDSGPAAIPAQPAKSLLVHAVSYKDAELSMPPNGKLPAHEIAALTEWVRRGLPFPGPTAAADTKTTIDIEAGRKFWSFQPLRRSAPPAVQRSAWAQRPIDAFVLAELEKQRLTPAPAAAPRVLIRRLHFDVIGLPPAPEEVEQFVRAWDGASAKRQAMVADVVERLLASPHYGERWGRYWLDLARYCDVGEPWAETKGLPHHYRDWVVKAINDDLPYDQFVVKQLAADMLEDPTPADQAALGFIGLSAIDNQRSKIHYVPGVEDAGLFVLPDGPHKTKLEYKMGAAFDVAMQIRGSAANLGPHVPRRFLGVLSPGEPRPFSGSRAPRIARSAKGRSASSARTSRKPSTPRARVPRPRGGLTSASTRSTAMFFAGAWPIRERTGRPIWSHDADSSY
ncbi:MAG: DUF1549 domain-containing protein [Gemmataceae bacterium]|nr:DUF1549 domain-containing protein [Gemmataceae bacterium]